MKFRPVEPLFLLFALLVSNYPPVQAAAPITKVLVTTGSSSERESALYIAQDQGYFRKYGLDLTLASSAGTVESVIKASLDGVAFIRNPENRPQVVKSLAKGLRLRRIEDVEESYQSVIGIYEKKIYPSVDGVRNVIRLLDTGNEKIRRLKAQDLVDDSVVRRLEKEGRF